MDKIDQKILLELDKNPRASFNQLGKKTRISKEVAQYRFKQLIKNKILTGFFAFINISKLGYRTYKILVKYKSVTREKQKEIINFIIKHKLVSWAGNCEGTWDLIITIISTSKEFINFFTEFFGTFGFYFKQKEILIPINAPLFNDKYLSNGKLLYNKNLDFHTQEEKIDKIDRKIILEISLNSRATFTEIGKKVNLSYWAVAQRFKHLVSKNILVLLKPRINFRKLGYSYYHLFIELHNEKIRNKLVSYYTQHKDCIMIMNHVGYYALHLEFVIKQDEMKEIIIDLREKFGNDIMSYEPLLIIEEYVMKLLR